MKKLVYLFAIIGLITIAACKQDKCDGVVCQYGGTCKDGACRCNSAHTGKNCELFTNPCDTIGCRVGRGKCDTVTLTCKCFAHYYGDSCKFQETPSKMYITGVRVNHFHPSDINGVAWDEDDDQSPADIYPRILRNGVVIYDGYQKNRAYAFKPDANYDSGYDLRFQEDSILISGADITDATYRVELWDHDNGFDDDLMEGRDFVQYTGVDGFPGSITVNDTSYYHDKFEFRINISPYYKW